MAQEVQNQERLTITFPDAASAEANRLVRELSAMLVDMIGDQIAVVRQKDDNATQDFGTTLIVALGTPAAISFVNGIRDFTRKRNARIEIRKDGTVVAVGDAATNIDVARVVEALRNAGL